jgi:hypothetical protein
MHSIAPLLTTTYKYNVSFIQVRKFILIDLNSLSYLSIFVPLVIRKLCTIHWRKEIGDVQEI